MCYCTDCSAHTFSLATKVAGYYDTANPATIQDINLEWEKLREILMVISPDVVETLQNMLELIRLSTRIRSPFRERTACIVRILRSLDEQSARNGAPPDARQELKSLVISSYGCSSLLIALFIASSG